MVTKWLQNQLKLSQNPAAIFYCENCDYYTSKKSNYDAHILTRKHKMVTNGYKMVTKQAKNKPADIETNKHFICTCGKEYSHRQGLWRHKSKCSYENNDFSQTSQTSETNENKLQETSLISLLLKQNNELIKEQSDIKQIILEIVKNGTNQINNCNNTIYNNTHNKAFNLNLFLNETCKNAMNITDFVDSIKLQLSDLIEVGELGYVAGISNIIVKNLNNLDETERPIHCTDKKRETFYVKDQGQWEKDDEEKKKVKRVIKSVACKNQKLLMKYKEEHPGCNYSESKFCDEYSKLVIEAMGGQGNNELEKEEKIIRNISKATTITQKM